MSKIKALQELIVVRVLNLSLPQLESAQVAISCIEAGEVATGNKVLKLMTEIENSRATNELLENRCCNLEVELFTLKKESKAVEKLKQKLKSTTTTLSSSTRQINKLQEEKEELEFAINNLQQTILRMRSNAA